MSIVYYLSLNKDTHISIKIQRLSHAKVWKMHSPFLQKTLRVKSSHMNTRLQFLWCFSLSEKYFPGWLVPFSRWRHRIINRKMLYSDIFQCCTFKWGRPDLRKCRPTTLIMLVKRIVWVCFLCYPIRCDSGQDNWQWHQSKMLLPTGLSSLYLPTEVSTKLT